jgi:hypothetical protein
MSNAPQIDEHDYGQLESAAAPEEWERTHGSAGAQAG